MNVRKLNQIIEDDLDTTVPSSSCMGHQFDEKEGQTNPLNAPLVFITPIRANQIRINRVDCVECSQSLSKIRADATLYLNLIQFVISVAVVALVASSLAICLPQLESCLLSQDLLRSFIQQEVKCECIDEQSSLAGSIVLINLISLVLMIYDTNQSRRGSVRLSNWLIHVLAWSGAWPLISLFMLVFKYRQGVISYKHTLLLGLLSPICGPLPFIFVKLI